MYRSNRIRADKPSLQGSPGERLYILGVDLLDDGHFRTYECSDTDESGPIKAFGGSMAVMDVTSAQLRRSGVRCSAFVLDRSLTGGGGGTNSGAAGAGRGRGR
jgi:hypothetical protein